MQGAQPTEAELISIQHALEAACVEFQVRQTLATVNKDYSHQKHVIQPDCSKHLWE